MMEDGSGEKEQGGAGGGGGNVQEKIHCVFESIVVEEPSTKRNYQPYKIVAIDKVRGAAVESGVEEALVTEKLDGTCVYIHKYQDVPWLWARHDRKPTKAADKRFKRFQTQVRAWQVGGEVGLKPVFEWDMSADFKDTPVDWMPASGVRLDAAGQTVPDEGGHIFGWVPIDPRGRTHLWHASAVDLEAGVALVLQPTTQQEQPVEQQQLELTLVPLVQLVGCTMELIGTNINANPYTLGGKKWPVHLLVRHGALPMEGVPLHHAACTQWFNTAPQGHVEGLVWHCANGHMYKLHRHHLHQAWPLEGSSVPRLTSSLPVWVNVDRAELEPDSSLYPYTRLHGQHFPSLQALCEAFTSQ